MKRLVGVGFCVCLVWGLAFADTFGTGANQFTVEFVDISGDASSANGTNISPWSSGDSGYRTFVDPGDYRLGKIEITNGQWNKFKANIAPIPVTGSPSYAYDTDPYFTGTNVPTNYVSWCEAAQFVNWLNTSSGKPAAYKFSGTQGTSNYTLEVWQAGDAGYNASNPFRNSNAHYFLPTEDEWVKAAYWNGTNLQTYANASAADLISGSPDAAKWNYHIVARNEPWAVGSGIQELNGTFDMMGNVWEWMESPWVSGDYLCDSDRGIRGGCYFDYGDRNLSSSFRYSYDPLMGNVSVGFRVASVPEPASAVLMLAGLGFILKRRA